MNIKNLLLFDAGDEVRDNEPPDSFTVMKYGKSRYTKGGEDDELDFVMTDALSVVKDFLKRGKDIVIDYEHQTLNGTEAPAAGWIKALTAEPDGLKASVEWTPRAAGMMRGREYRYFSPVLQEKNNRKMLHSVALTNHPALHGIPALVADDSEEEEINNEQTKESKMNQILKSIASKLGAVIPDDMGEDEAGKNILAGLETLLSKQSTMVAMSDLETAKAEISTLKSQNAVEAAVKARKLTPEMLPWAHSMAAKDIQAFADLIKVMPEVLKAPPAESKVDVSTPDPKADTLSLTDIDVKVFKTMNLTEKQIEEIKNQKKG